jgi:hypothetical protein
VCEWRSPPYGAVVPVGFLSDDGGARAVCRAVGTTVPWGGRQFRFEFG